MRKFIHRIYVVFGVICFFIAFTAAIQEDMMLFGLGMFCSLFSFLTAFIAEPRQRETEQERKHDDKCQTWGVGMMTLLTVAAVIVVMMMSSCSTSGYGCHGKSKIITRVQ